MVLNKIPTFDEVKNWVNTYADVPNADHADDADNAAQADNAAALNNDTQGAGGNIDSDTVDGKHADDFATPDSVILSGDIAPNYY